MSATSPEPARPRVAPPARLWSWLLAGLAVAILGTLLLVKVVGSGDGTSAAVTTLTPAPAALLAEVTSVPARVFDDVGVSSPLVPVTPPVLLGVHHADHPTTKAVVVYVGAEYCSFCAAERWPLILALSRFGTFSRLYELDSSPLDYAPDTPSFSFVDTTYTSRFVTFDAYEVRSDVLEPDGEGFEPLMVLPRDVRRLLHQEDPRSVYPFVDLDGRALVPQAELSPETFVAITRDEVAAGLSNPRLPVTEGIVASANYLTAVICASDGERPAAVCTSDGARAADAALGLAG